MSDFLNDFSKEYFNNITTELDNLGVEYELDPTLVRGLDYYSHVVFEYHYISEEGTNLGAIGAGGHYDNLVKEVGGPQLSSVGLAFGVERLNLLLKELSPDTYAKPEIDVYGISIGEEARVEVYHAMEFLRSNGFACDMSFENKSMGASFKIATRKNAKFALIAGEDEIKNGVFQVKDLKKQEQETVNAEDLAEYLQNKIEF
jgi:histidyl-tRNA synthetase